MFLNGELALQDWTYTVQYSMCSVQGGCKVQYGFFIAASVQQHAALQCAAVLQKPAGCLGAHHRCSEIYIANVLLKNPTYLNRCGS